MSRRTAAAVLAAVRSTMAAHATTQVALAGHSLGAALSMLDAVYLRLQLPATTTIKFVGYGTPRVRCASVAFTAPIDT